MFFAFSVESLSPLQIFYVRIMTCMTSFSAKNLSRLKLYIILKNYFCHERRSGWGIMISEQWPFFIMKSE